MFIQEEVFNLQISAAKIKKNRHDCEKHQLHIICLTWLQWNQLERKLFSDYGNCSICVVSAFLWTSRRDDSPKLKEQQGKKNPPGLNVKSCCSRTANKKRSRRMFLKHFVMIWPISTNQDRFSPSQSYMLWPRWPLQNYHTIKMEERERAWVWLQSGDQLCSFLHLTSFKPA